MKINDYINIFAFVLGSSLVLGGLMVKPLTAYAQSSSPIDTVSPTPIVDADYLRQQYEFLKDSAVRYEDKVSREQQDMIGLVQVVLALLGGAGIVGIVAFLGTIFGINKKADKALNEFITKKQAYLQTKAEGWAKDVVNAQFGFGKRIMVVANKEKWDAMKSEEIKLLNRRGFNDVVLTEPGKPDGNSDLIIFVYQDTLSGQLEKLSTSLVKNNSEVPLLVYYAGQVDRSLLKNYPYATFAQSAITLVSWTFTILSAMPGLKEDET